MFISLVVHVHSIKFTLHLILGATPPIMAIYGNIFIWFIDTSGFIIVKYLNITLVWVPSFSVGPGLGYFTSSSLNCCKNRILFSNLDIQVLVQEL